jgi:hypothetical protein
VSVLLIAPIAAWAAMALWFRLPAPEWAKIGAAAAMKEIVRRMGLRAAPVD